MSENTKIEWATHTFNGWEGCQPVGPGCDHCYAEARNARFGGGVAVNWGPGAPRRRTSIANWRKPLVWNANHDAFFAKHGYRQRVFCSSLADVFDNEVDPQWRHDLWELIWKTPELDWLLLTKRIGNVNAMLPEEWGNGMVDHWSHVWIGATICNQAEADRDIPKLLAVPAAKHFLSIEPLIGPVDLQAAYLPCPNSVRTVMDPETGAFECCKQCDYTGTSNEMGIDWVIVGGESGPNARPMHPDWARSLRDQCETAGVPFMFKQHGEWREPMPGEEFDTSMGHAAKPPAFIISYDGAVRCFQDDRFRTTKVVIKVGKKAAGRLLDGREWNGVPA